MQTDEEHYHEIVLAERIAKIRSVFRDYDESNFYISYSGGKDSNVVCALIDLAVPGNTIPRVFMRTGLELNAVVDFVLEKANHDFRIHVIEPQVNVREYLEKYGYPFKSKTHARKVDMYQTYGLSKATKNYLNLENDPARTHFVCPKSLRYQFTPENKLKISAWCCYGMKERPLYNWQKQMSLKYFISGMRRGEGGGRNNVNCLSFTKDTLRGFHPLAPVSDAWMEWFISKYKVDLPIVYYPPYNFPRTGCKGCPFAIDLQHELDVLHEFFPAEYKQCELIWKPVYDEYRRLKYRLKEKAYDC